MSLDVFKKKNSYEFDKAFHQGSFLFVVDSGSWWTEVAFFGGFANFALFHFDENKKQSFELLIGSVFSFDFFVKKS